MSSIYEFTDYIDYLFYREKIFRKNAKGFRSKLAAGINAQRAYVSLVFKRKQHLSAENAERVNSFLKHNPEEGWFFLLLVQYGRAGTEDLKLALKKQINGILKNREELASRIGRKQSIEYEDQVRFVSSWLYLGVMMAAAIPRLRTYEDIARELATDLEAVREAGEFLVSRGFLRLDASGKLVPKDANMHFSSDPTLRSRRHTGWRLKALASLERMREGNFHGSTVFAVSKKDAQKIRSMILDFLENLQPVAVKSKEEALYALCLDYFRL